MSKTRTLLVVASTLLLGLAGPVQADQAARRYEVQTPLSDIKAGAYRTEVHAPLDVVRRVVTDFAAYSQNIKRFEKAKVIGRHGDATDVYLQVPILKGAAKVWAVVRFQPPKGGGAGGGEVIVGRMLKGNVKRLDARWQLSKIDDQHTKLDLQLLIVPDLPLPVPDSLVSGEAAAAAEKAVRGLRSRSEQLSAR